MGPSFWPARLAADSAYGSAENLAWLVHEHGIEPHIPVFDKSQRSDGTFSRSDFAYDHEHDLYVCPDGKPLRLRQKVYRTERPTLFRHPEPIHRSGVDTPTG